MSYILEALKKSQRDRELGQVPDLASETQTTAAATSPGLRRWLAIALLLIALLILATLYRLFGQQLLQPQPAQLPLAEQHPASTVTTALPAANHKQQSKEQQKAQPVVPPTPAQPAPVEPTVTKPLQQSVTTVPPPVPTRARIQVQPAIPRIVEPGKPTTTGAPQQAAPVPDEMLKNQTEVERIREEYNQLLATQQPQKQAPVVDQPKATPRPARRQQTTKQNTYPEAHELPSNIVSRLPPRNIMLQSYSEDPAQRFVIINSQKMTQGQSTGDGLQIVEIRVDGLLFRFDGHEFFQPR